MSGIPSVKAVFRDTPYSVSLSDDLGHVWQADEPLEMGGGNTGPSPERLMLASLGTCTAITLRMVAARRNLPLTGLQVELQLNPNACPMHKLLTGEVRVNTVLMREPAQG